MVDWALATFALSLGVLIATLALRKRILRALGVLLIESSVEFAGTLVLSEEVRRQLPEPVRARADRFRAMAGQLLERYTPLFVATAAKSIKFRLPNAPPQIVGEGGGIDLNALLGMLPKRYQGIAALAMPFLRNMIPGLGGKGGGTASATENPFLKELGSK